MPGASTFAPSTSVHAGSDFVPAAMAPGSTAGIADHMFHGSTHTAPGERSLFMIVNATGALPAAAPNRGRVARIEISGLPVMAISDGTAWRTLTTGDVL